MSQDLKPEDDSLSDPALPASPTRVSTSSKEPTTKPADTKKYPTGITLALIVLSVCCSTFLVALDGSIIATAIPTITSQFNSLQDVSWYNSALLLTTCAFQLPFGRGYTLFTVKWVYCFAIALFEIGSAVCGAAPDSITLIVGRAIQGMQCRDLLCLLAFNFPHFFGALVRNQPDMAYT